MEPLFEGRRQAGHLLVEKIHLSEQEKASALILALPRGGVPVAFEISQALQIPLEVLIVRKIDHPRQEEYGIGAVSENNYQWLDPEALGLEKISPMEINAVIDREKVELARRVKHYRHNQALPSLSGKTVIIVDDGLATGVTARAAAHFAKAQGAKKIILALPICSEQAIKSLKREVDEVICLHSSSNLIAIGYFYRYFDQTSDEEVMHLLARSRPESVEKILLQKAKVLKSPVDLAPLIEKISKAQIVMLGESSHGTHEFYEWRRLISQELIAKHGFNFIAVEGDWPPSSAVDDYIHSNSDKEHAREVLAEFRRWPTWMWANTEVIQLIDWMKNYNKQKPTGSQVGFFGLDVYSLFESIDEVLNILKKIEPGLVRYAQILYGCFEPFQKDEKSYAKSLMKFSEGCEAQVLTALQNLLELRLEGKQKGSLFNAQQNARIVKNAENYYRAMIHGDEDSWNVRDRHMMETLNLLLQKHGPSAKAIVWAHNTHIGDYHATNMLSEGQINIGGMAREEWGKDKVALVGFGTYQGEVIASHAWDGPIEIMKVPPAPPESYEELFHKVARNLRQNSFFFWMKNEFRNGELARTMGHRAIGVVYHPAYEKYGNYVPTSLSQRYDGFIFCDQTTALDPLIQKFIREEIPETWPRGV